MEVLRDGRWVQCFLLLACKFWLSLVGYIIVGHTVLTKSRACWQHAFSGVTVYSLPVPLFCSKFSSIGALTAPIGSDRGDASVFNAIVLHCYANELTQLADLCLRWKLAKSSKITKHANESQEHPWYRAQPGLTLCNIAAHLQAQPHSLMLIISSHMI